ncbi:Uncharacterised protein [Campylobacter hyointestinalis subsp. hyointestinalis]|uniref:Uncharacterized protein n=1 Tax=Campylobacter hyointestinalis subsp. hyointestinalis TaxID=91352 RepID=A0A0S4R1D4_CAMHY|nr:hypothetical protein [Campylobacter hyointestinalis]CUU67916.1 Uncharacterised protein [Campylobacter hyointestinalis subsp. hyointestinalis]
MELKFIDGFTKEILELEKIPVDNGKIYTLPSGLCKFALNIELKVLNNKKYDKTSFILDISKSGIKIGKCKFQHRINKIDIIARIDFNSNHTNPEFKTSKAPNNIYLSKLMQKYSLSKLVNTHHMHIFIDGYADKWAFPIIEYELEEHSGIMPQIEQFCDFCNIKQINFKTNDKLFG